MSQAIGDPARIRQNVLMLVARLYGTEEARNLARRWGAPIPP